MRSKIGTMLACAMALSLTVFAETPDKFVRYVESTGSQYIDTGIVGRYGTKAECKVAWMEFGDKAFLDCGDWSNNTRFFMCHCSTASGHMFLGYRGKYNVHKTYDLLFEMKRVYTYTTDISAPDADDNTTAKVTIDGITADTVVTNSLDTGLNLYVFAMNHNGAAYAHSKTRCYGLKIWQDGTLVRDFKPCVHGGRAGLYDAQNDKIYYPSGGDLVYDTNCDIPDAYIDYVESFGNSYIDTGVIGRYGTKAECKVEWMDFADSAFLACGDWSQNTRFFMCYCRNTSGTMFAAQGTGDNVQYNGRDLAFEKNRIYTYTSDFSAIDGSGNSLNTISIDGTEIWSKTKAGINTERSLYVFACNQKSNTVIGKSKTRCYGLKIWQRPLDGGNLVLVRDFRPCLKYGEAALYDDVSKTIFYPTGDKLGFNNSVAADPDEVIYVDYIESDGYTHYLDTGVSAESPTRATGEFSWTRVRTAVEENQRVGESYRSYLACGYWNSNSDANRFYMITETAQKPWIGYGNNSQSFGSAFVAGTKYAFDVSFTADGQTASFVPESGSTSTISTNWTDEASGQGNLYLFACNDAKNKKPIYRSAAKCYGLTIWQGETKVREFKPCVKDGQAALYDTVSGRIFYPVPAIPAEGNTGAVKEESARSPVDAYLEYVETDGTQYIDTEVVGRSWTSAEFIETNLRPNVGNGDVEECFLGAIGSDANSRFYMWYHAGKDTLGFGYGSSWWRPSMSNPATPAAKWDVGYEDVYRLYCGTTTHARVSFAKGAQSFTAIDDANRSRTLFSSRTLSDNVDTERNLYLFARNNNGTPDAFAKSRLYWMKLKQDGRLVRKFQPVRLKNGLVGLWDHIEGKTYLPKTSAGSLAYFSAVGSETEMMFFDPLVLIIR